MKNINENIRAREVYFAPALKPEMFPKALSSGADIVCLELEDGLLLSINQLLEQMQLI